MDVQQGVKRAVMSVTVTRVDGTQEERVVAFSSDDPEEEVRINEALQRGEMLTETDLIPHGEMSPLEE